MKEGLLKKIKSRGYWRINFQPIVATTKLKTLKECEDIVERNSVQLRGWDYPHIPKRNDENGSIATMGNFIEAWENWSKYKEFWRMYKSGQFLYYRSLREDWLEDDPWAVKYVEKIKPGKYLGTNISVLYEVTETFVFLSRLVQANLYNEGVIVNLNLYNIKDRELWNEDPHKSPFVFPKKTGATQLNFSKTYTKNIILRSSHQLALDIIQQTFDAFGWNPPIEQLAADQQLLLDGKV